MSAPRLARVLGLTAVALVLFAALAGAVHPVHEDAGVERTCPACPLHHETAVSTQSTDFAAPALEAGEPRTSDPRPAVVRAGDVPVSRGPPACI